MAELNLDYYTAKDHYSDGDIEETLLKMAQELSLIHISEPTRH